MEFKNMQVSLIEDYTELMFKKAEVEKMNDLLQQKVIELKEALQKYNPDHFLLTDYNWGE